MNPSFWITGGEITFRSRGSVFCLSGVVSSHLEFSIEDQVTAMALQTRPSLSQLAGVMSRNGASLFCRASNHPRNAEPPIMARIRVRSPCRIRLAARHTSSPAVPWADASAAGPAALPRCPVQRKPRNFRRSLDRGRTGRHRRAQLIAATADSTATSAAVWRSASPTWHSP
jgi:hypothetical protein